MGTSNVKIRNGKHVKETTIWTVDISPFQGMPCPSQDWFTCGWLFLFLKCSLDNLGISYTNLFIFSFPVGPLAAQKMSSLSEYALRMTRLSARLFGEIARPTDSKSMKVVKLFSEQPLAKRKETYDWYPNHNTYFALMGTLRFLGLYR